MIIALDVDDVILDMTGHYTNTLKELGLWKGIDNKTWCLKDRYELSDEEFYQAWNEALKNFSTLELVQGALHYLKYIDSLPSRYQVVFVTAVSKDRHEERISNLKLRLSNEIEFIKNDKFDLICTGEYKTKKDVLKLLRPGLFVDDRLLNHYEVREAEFEKIYVNHEDFQEPELEEMLQYENFHVVDNMYSALQKTIELIG